MVKNEKAKAYQINFVVSTLLNACHDKKSIVWMMPNKWAKLIYQLQATNLTSI
jgi:hypothetical protein